MSPSARKDGPGHSTNGALGQARRVKHDKDAPGTAFNRLPVDVRARPQLCVMNRKEPDQGAPPAPGQVDYPRRSPRSVRGLGRVESGVSRLFSK